MTQLKVEILAAENCDDLVIAKEKVERVLVEEGLETEPLVVTARTTEEAIKLRLPGSPTVRVNGKDVVPTNSSEYSLNCRMYGNNGISTPWPPEQAIRDAIRAAADSKSETVILACC